MTAPEYTRLPDEIWDGDSIIVYLTFADFLPPDWVVTLSASSSDGATALTPIPATDNGDGRHKLTIDDTATGEMGADSGTWKYQLRAVHGSLGTRVLETGRFEAHENFEDAAADLRTHAETMVDALRLMIEGTAPINVQALSINGRSLNKYTPGELREWLEHYEQLVRDEIADERLAQGRAPGNKILMRF